MRIIKFLPTPKTLHISVKPPLLGGTAELTLTDQFIKKTDMTQWCEDIVSEYDSGSLTFTDSGLVIDNTNKRNILHQLQSNLDKLVISYMNDTVGYGVFALSNIPKGSLVAIYTGVISPVIEDRLSGYQVKIPGNHSKNAIDAKHYGNIARFFQQLPKSTRNEDSEITLEDFKFDDSINTSEIATENLDIFCAEHEGAPVFIFIANREIKAGEQLGWDYGRGYWLASNIVPSLFNIKGEIIPPSLYITTRLLLCIKNGEVKEKRSFAIYITTKMCESMLDDDILQVDNGDTPFTLSKNDLLITFQKYKNSPFAIIDKSSDFTFTKTTDERENNQASLASNQQRSSQPSTTNAATASQTGLFSEGERGSAAAAALSQPSLSTSEPQLR